jgi:LmbE family N-acetylglucosaminyl deacetylase
MKKILVVAAHPDDEILGCGGTVSRMIKEGFESYTLILGEGITSRDQVRDIKKRKNEVENLKKQIYKAASIIGTRDVFLYNFPDNRFDSIDLLDIIKVVEKVKTDIRPDIIFTHYGGDLNIDHRITYETVMVATRPLVGETVKEIYAFKTLSSTEWGFPSGFDPDVFFDITDSIDIKCKAFQTYKSELRGFPHPRSLEGIKIDAAYWGMCTGVNYAEAFMSIRILR